MCDFSPVRNWLIAMMVALGGAISSVILGVAYPLIAAACFWAAFGWAAGALGFGIAASLALDTFCKCASNSPACVSTCGTMKSLMSALIPTLFVGMAMTGALAFSGAPVNWMLAVLAAAGILALGLAATLLGLLVDLGKCQSVTSLPIPPPIGGSGSGTAPVG